MNIFVAFAIFITIAALASYINYKFIKLPSTIGLMVIGLAMSLGIIGLSALGVNFKTPIEELLNGIDFGESLMHGMLSFLLFAGAIKININDLAKQKFVVATLATGGVILTTFIVGTALYYILPLFELSFAYIYCLIFGALIAPTDPVAVLALIKTIKVPKSLETKIAGESLFNDGVGVVVFTVLVGIAVGSGEVNAGNIIMLFVEEAVGGVVFGIGIGFLAFKMLQGVDDYAVEILLTLALVCGGYALASQLHTSGPIAIVVAGLLIGNYGRRLAMSETTRMHLDQFWELIDEILNAILFVWIGMEVLILTFTTDYLIIGLIAIPLTLGARYISVWSAISALKFRRQFTRNATIILTWGGLRGGISIALALSLSAGAARDLIVSITYVVVIFSILVQGLTIKSLVQKKIQ
ncbi:MAG: sodium:proton antiporter [candidate division Zixibacteria bacterium]|nr:sodium:proton antiporter [candidate division Zixibacteria bacterium]